MTRENGIWVFHLSQPLPTSAMNEMLQQIREERDLANRQGRMKGFFDTSVEELLPSPITTAETPTA
jgi:hypothetical protein